MGVVITCLKANLRSLNITATHIGTSSYRIVVVVYNVNGKQEGCTVRAADCDLPPRGRAIGSTFK